MKLRAVGMSLVVGLVAASVGVAVYKNMSVDRGVTHVEGPPPEYIHDFSTPEGAVLCLKDALRAKDIEAAVRCHDFAAQARLEVRAQQLPEGAIDIAKLAQTKEQAFRQHYAKHGFPNLSDADVGRFVGRSEVEKGLVVLTEVVQHPNGQRENVSLFVTDTGNGWRVAGHVSR